MARKFLDYQEELIKKLQDPEYAQAYLNAALMDEDERLFLLALKNVLEAQGALDFLEIIIENWNR